MNISSINNEKVKFWCSLNQKKFRAMHNCFLVEGDHAVDIALKKGLVKELIVLDSKYEAEKIFFVTESIMKKISTQASISSVCAVVSCFEFSLGSGNILLLDNLQDPGNMGTIIRSAVAFNFSTIVIGDGCVDIYNEKVIRASEGMIFNISFMKSDLVNDINFFKNKGYTVVGTNLSATSSMSDVNFEKLALVIGNEGSGINPLIDTDCDVLIKMESACESLNAAISASILMNEVYNG